MMDSLISFSSDDDKEQIISTTNLESTLTAEPAINTPSAGKVDPETGVTHRSERVPQISKDSLAASYGTNQSQ